MRHRTYLIPLLLLACGPGCSLDKETTDATSGSESSTAPGTSTVDETTEPPEPTSSTTGVTDATTADTTGATAVDTTSSTTSEDAEEIGKLWIFAPDEDEILLGSTESIHVVLTELTVGELLEIRAWSEEGFIDEPSCNAPDCTFELDLAGVVWGRRFRIGASADVMTDGGLVTIDAPPVEVEMISP
ncbi:hypothetical protein [Nannocystis sp. SCPEA4]|uniref:hypothetical protein n=1 Tax=Nannocystis sp. SCPEA4 TaxID=2996787 RepID=UPI00226DF5C9|nr:hypothetical protein [Nannocystis sp. SCPEA4]MCY1054150.1 hypothetical protein [Nannocystis sp. SCPEA4]